MAMTTGSANLPAIGGHDALHRAAVAARGVIAIALGACALYYRVYSTVLVAVFAIFVILDGAVRLGVALRSTGRDRAWLIHGAEGIAGIALGIVTFNVAKDLISLTWTIAEWAFIVGVLSIAFATAVWGRLHDAWLWLLGGILLIVLAGAMLWFTLGGLLAPGVALGIFAIVYGLVTLMIAVRKHPES